MMGWQSMRSKQGLATACCLGRLPTPRLALSERRRQFLAIEGLTDEARRKALWDNAARLFKIESRASALAGVG